MLPSREPAPTGRSLLTAHFGRKSSGSADTAQKEVKDDGAKQTEPMTSAQSSTQSAQAQKRESEKDEKNEENAEAQDLSCATLYVLCIDGAHLKELQQKLNQICSLLGLDVLNPS